MQTKEIESDLGKIRLTEDELDDRLMSFVELFKSFTGSYTSEDEQTKRTVAKMVLVELSVDDQGGLVLRENEDFKHLFGGKNIEWCTR